MRDIKNKRAFDWESFFNQLEHAKLAYSFREIAKQSGASHSSIFRAHKGKKIDIDNLIKIIDWIGIDINQFIY